MSTDKDLQPKDYTVAKDLRKLERIERAAQQTAYNFLPMGMAALFLIAVFYGVYLITGHVNNHTVVMLAAVLGGYMALNIGANDVANNVGPAVGSKALTMAGALGIAAIFEAAGAIIAGGEVVSTISRGIINQEQLVDGREFIMLMMSALFAAALWINLATWMRAPVSTTHSIVGGVMGAGIATAGFSVVNWPTMSAIVASWVVSPVLGGLIAALLFKAIKFLILEKEDKLLASERWVPILIALMTAAFAMYLMDKGFKNIWRVSNDTIFLTGIILLLGVPFWVRPFVVRKTKKLQNRAKQVNKLFTLPLIVSAALLSFAHGSNDVANAIGPLAAIVSTSGDGLIAAKVTIPLWVMVVGALGISLGLVLFGPGIIRTVGEKITKLDQVRAFCVALSAAVTVIIASGMGLPVSSTHIAVGAVFGVGLYREFSSHKRRKKAQKLAKQELIRRKLVRRQHILQIAAAWVITVPCTSFLAAGIYITIYSLQFGSLITTTTAP